MDFKSYTLDSGIDVGVLGLSILAKLDMYLHSSCCFGLGTTMAMIIITARIEIVAPTIILFLVEDKKPIAQKFVIKAKV